MTQHQSGSGHGDRALERARRALARAGLDSNAPLVRASSNANEAWLGAEFVLRVNARGDIGRLSREARIASRLPAEAAHPGVLAFGDDGEIEWSLVRRVAGVDLSRVWPKLDSAQRERAARDLARGLRAVHRVSDTDLPTDADMAPPHTLPLAPLLELLQRTREKGVDPQLLDEVEAFVRARWSAFDASNFGLVHGDPHLENMLCHEGKFSALIDFEWSRRSWIEVDLEILLSFCNHPFFFVSADYEDRARSEDYAAVPGWFRDEYPEWFAHPRCRDRLAVLHVSRTLGLLGDSPPLGPRDPGNPRDRRNHLSSILDGSSYLFTD